MVCPSNEGIIQATIKDTNGSLNSLPISIFPSMPVSEIFKTVEDKFQYDPSSIELTIQYSKGKTIVLNHHRNKTLGEVGINFDQTIRNTIIITMLKQKNVALIDNDAPDDDLLLGASASPTAGETPGSSMDPQLSIEYTCLPGHIGACNYVGLVNQAMTCYLNSLLQALYMTPEFRNALYNWEYDGLPETKSIPYQLQRLFLKLQTSTRSAIETTGLTSSFGWGLLETWQQHDIQELCRVMFDALEQKFKNTQQANLINDLYEGKMLDYVKCLECEIEKSREDMFLDIPLPVRPFGSNTAYNSVEEALRAFVQPETLDKNNQYLCEKCNKKCNAYKGFKFMKFPYLLTLHLKRFDFDNSTMHRIKLNDRVVFPEVLNLNSFITTANSNSEIEGSEEAVVKCDDCSTTDSGSALDDESCQFNDATPVFSGNYDNCQDDDEGIDVSLCSHHQENEKNHKKDPKGPYIYELFSIMIHSGSASGGHYYAYIKDFDKNEWFCFNDQIVSRITEDDIQKTYGGGSLRSCYSGAYSSSTNAYMLMYRQIDKERNSSFMKVEDFPVHIKKLLYQMQEEEKCDQRSREYENCTASKIVVYCQHPDQRELVNKKIRIESDTTLSEATKMAYEQFQLEKIVNIENCRLVTYNKAQNCINRSFEEPNIKFCDIFETVSNYEDWKLEIKSPGADFQVYKPGGIDIEVFYINLETEEVERGPYTIHVNVGETVRDVKICIAKMLRMDHNAIELVPKSSCNNDTGLYNETDEMLIQFDANPYGCKLFVTDALDEYTNKFNCKWNRIIGVAENIITLEVILPNTDSNALENLFIPPLDTNQNLDKSDMGSGDRLRISPQPIHGTISDGFGDQSNSEDSSLSESDRTLVGDVPGETSVLLSSNSNSPADQHMASPSDPTEDSFNHEVFGNSGEEMNWDDDTTTDVCQHLPTHSFKLVSRVPNYNDFDSSGSCIIYVDKRMTFAKFKKNLEPIVGVSTEYFKVFKQNSYDMDEWTKLDETLQWTKDKEKLCIKLGRVLKPNEYSCGIYHLTPENSEPSKYLFQWVITRGQTMGQIKKDIILAAKKLHSLEITFNKSRLRAKKLSIPGKVYLDEEKFYEDKFLDSNCRSLEIYLQDLEEGEKVTNINQLCVFVKRWIPSTLKLTPFHEVVLNLKTVEELKCKLSEKSNIPTEFVEVAVPKSTFPCDLGVLEIIEQTDWNTNICPVEVCSEGKIYLYRDSRDQLDIIALEEQKKNRKVTIHFGKHVPKATYSNRKEQGLKIYIDLSPKKTDNGCGD